MGSATQDIDKDKPKYIRNHVLNYVFMANQNSDLY